MRVRNSEDLFLKMDKREQLLPFIFKLKLFIGKCLLNAKAMEIHLVLFQREVYGASLKND